MTPTSDERREVAERLREYGNDALKDGSLLRTLKDVTGADSWRHVLLALADLIDPTCKNLTTRPADVLFCSECGEHVDIASVENADDYHPRYCPNCGARVVSDDD